MYKLTICYYESHSRNVLIRCLTGILPSHIYSGEPLFVNRGIQSIRIEFRLEDPNCEVEILGYAAKSFFLRVGKKEMELNEDNKDHLENVIREITKLITDKNH